LTDQEKLTVISFDETYVSKRICYDKKNEQMIGPHKCVQTVMARGFFSILKNLVCKYFLSKPFLNRAHISMEATNILQL